jgi:hypothetical protein
MVWCRNEEESSAHRAVTTINAASPAGVKSTATSSGEDNGEMLALRITKLQMRWEKPAKKRNHGAKQSDSVRHQNKGSNSSSVIVCVS